MKRTDVAVIGALAMLAVACFYPLLKYYFAQDDFMLIQWATREPVWLLERMFARGASYFRPLTMFVYFGAAGRVFGADPLPWHLVSLLLHVTNAALTFALLVRLRLSRPAAMLGAAALTFNLACFHVVGWITCTQQLLATTFTLATLWLWCGALGGHRRARWLSLLCFLAAGLSLEQTYFLPAVLFVMGVTGTGAAAVGPRRALRMLRPHLIVMAALLGFRLLWKGAPIEGQAQVGVGLHLLLNLWRYSAALVDYFPEVPGRLETLAGFALRPLLVPLLVIYHLARGRRSEALFAVTFVAAMLAPALALRDHAFHYHTYLAAFGVAYLVALLFEDLLGLVARAPARRAALRWLVAGALVGVLGFGASWQVRRIERAAVNSRSLPWQEQTSFVLHRALLAANARDDILTKVELPDRIRELRLVLFVPGQGVVGRGHSDMKWALGQGALTNVVLGERFEVRFDETATDLDALAREDSLERRVLLYDPYGRIHTPGELRGRPDLR